MNWNRAHNWVRNMLWIVFHHAKQNFASFETSNLNFDGVVFVLSTFPQNKVQKLHVFLKLMKITLKMVFWVKVILIFMEEKWILNKIKLFASRFIVWFSRYGFLKIEVFTWKSVPLKFWIFRQKLISLVAWHRFFWIPEWFSDKTANFILSERSSETQTDQNCTKKWKIKIAQKSLSSFWFLEKNLQSKTLLL